MAWPDGSRFLVAKGVKWGTGPAFYKGASYDTPWNHDLNWKDYCKADNDRMARDKKTHVKRELAPDTSIVAVVHASDPYVWRLSESRGQSASSEGGIRRPRSGGSLARNFEAYIQNTIIRPKGAAGGKKDALNELEASSALSRSGSRTLMSPGGHGAGEGEMRKVISETRATRKELGDLKDTLRRQQDMAVRTEQRMEQIAKELSVIAQATARGPGASPKRNRRK